MSGSCSALHCWIVPLMIPESQNHHHSAAERRLRGSDLATALAMKEMPYAVDWGAVLCLRLNRIACASEG